MPAQKAINTEPKMCVLFVLAFGTPRPFHRAAIHNWSRVTSTRFILITDTPDAWSQLSAGMDNIGIIPISIDDYFASFYSFFNVADKQAFIAEFGHAFFNACTGWTACGLRPLLRLLLGTSEYPEPLWGWMDYDILLDSERFERWIKPCARGDVGACLFAHTGIVWEQCKVFRNEFNILQHYETVLLTDPMLAMLPMEARLCQFIRKRSTWTW